MAAELYTFDRRAKQIDKTPAGKHYDKRHENKTLSESNSKGDKIKNRKSPIYDCCKKFHSGFGSKNSCMKYFSIEKSFKPNTLLTIQSEQHFGSTYVVEREVKEPCFPLDSKHKGKNYYYSDVNITKSFKSIANDSSKEKKNKFQNSNNISDNRSSRYSEKINRKTVTNITEKRNKKSHHTEFQLLKEKGKSDFFFHRVHSDNRKSIPSSCYVKDGNLLNNQTTDCRSSSSAESEPKTVNDGNFLAKDTNPSGNYSNNKIHKNLKLSENLILNLRRKFQNHYKKHKKDDNHPNIKDNIKSTNNVHSMPKVKITLSDSIPLKNEAKPLVMLERLEKHLGHTRINQLNQSGSVRVFSNDISDSKNSFEEPKQVIPNPREKIHPRKENMHIEGSKCTNKQGQINTRCPKAETYPPSSEVNSQDITNALLVISKETLNKTSEIMNQKSFGSGSANQTSNTNALQNICDESKKGLKGNYELAQASNLATIPAQHDNSCKNQLNDSEEQLIDEKESKFKRQCLSGNNNMPSSKVDASVYKEGSASVPKLVLYLKNDGFDKQYSVINNNNKQNESKECKTAKTKSIKDVNHYKKNDSPGSKLMEKLRLKVSDKNARVFQEEKMRSSFSEKFGCFVNSKEKEDELKTWLPQRYSFDSNSKTSNSHKSAKENPVISTKSNKHCDNTSAHLSETDTGSQSPDIGLRSRYRKGKGFYDETLPPFFIDDNFHYLKDDTETKVDPNFESSSIYSAKDQQEKTADPRPILHSSDTNSQRMPLKQSISEGDKYKKAMVDRYNNNTNNKLCKLKANDPQHSFELNNKEKYSINESSDTENSSYRCISKIGEDSKSSIQLNYKVGRKRSFSFDGALLISKKSNSLLGSKSSSHDNLYNNIKEFSPITRNPAEVSRSDIQRRVSNKSELSNCSGLLEENNLSMLTDNKTSPNISSETNTEFKNEAKILKKDSKRSGDDSCPEGISKNSNHKDNSVKKKRKHRKKRTNEGDCTNKQARQYILNKHRQSYEEEESGKRLAKELPRFNWLEEKILRNESLQQGGSSSPSTMTPSNPSTSSGMTSTSKSTLSESPAVVKTSRSLSLPADSLRTPSKPLPALIPSSEFSSSTTEIPPNADSNNTRSSSTSPPVLIHDSEISGNANSKSIPDEPQIPKKIEPLPAKRNSADTEMDPPNAVANVKRRHVQAHVTPFIPTIKIASLAKPKLPGGQEPIQNNVNSNNTQSSSVSSTLLNEELFKHVNEPTTKENPPPKDGESICDSNENEIQNTNKSKDDKRSEDREKAIKDNSEEEKESDKENAGVGVSQKLSILTEAFKTKLNAYIDDDENMTDNQEQKPNELVKVNENANVMNIKADSKIDIRKPKLSDNPVDSDDQSKITSSIPSEEETPVLISIPEAQGTYDDTSSELKNGEPHKENALELNKKYMTSSQLAGWYDWCVKMSQDLNWLKNTLGQMLHDEKLFKKTVIEPTTSKESNSTELDQSKKVAEPIVIDLSDNEDMRTRKQKEKLEACADEKSKFKVELEKRSLTEDSLEPSTKRFKEDKEEPTKVIIRYLQPKNENENTNNLSRKDNEHLRNLLGIFSNDLAVIPVIGNKEKLSIKNQNVDVQATIVSSTKEAQQNTLENSEPCGNIPELQKLLCRDLKCPKTSLPEPPSLIPSSVHNSLTLRRHSDPNDNSNLANHSNYDQSQTSRPILKNALIEVARRPNRYSPQTSGLLSHVNTTKADMISVPEAHPLNNYHTSHPVEETPSTYPSIVRMPTLTSNYPHPDEDKRKGLYHSVSDHQEMEMESASNKSREVQTPQTFQPKIIIPPKSKPPNVQEWPMPLHNRISEPRLPVSAPPPRMIHHTTLSVNHLAQRFPTMGQSPVVQPPLPNKMADIYPISKIPSPNTQRVLPSHMVAIHDRGPPGQFKQNDHISGQNSSNEGPPYPTTTHYQPIVSYASRPHPPTSQPIPIPSPQGSPIVSSQQPSPHSPGHTQNPNHKIGYPNRPAAVFTQQRPYLHPPESQPQPPQRISPHQRMETQQVPQETYRVATSQGPQSQYISPQLPQKKLMRYDQTPSYPIQRRSPLQHPNKVPYDTTHGMQLTSPKSTQNPSSRLPPPYGNYDPQIQSAVLTANQASYPVHKYEQRIQRLPNHIHMKTLESQDQPPAPPSKSSKKNCLICREPAQFLCSGCQFAWYCSKTCQRKDWVDHSPTCNRG